MKTLGVASPTAYAACGEASRKQSLLRFDKLMLIAFGINARKSDVALPLKANVLWYFRFLEPVKCFHVLVADIFEIKFIMIVIFIFK